MEKINWEDLWLRLQCFYPVTAEDGGNYTEILLVNGERLLDPRKTKTVLTGLARVFALDVGLIKERSRKVLHCRREVPLALLPELVLVPVKSREAPAKDAGSLGYLVLSRITEWDAAPEDPFRTRIFFNEGSFMDSLSAPVTVRKKLAEAEMVLGDYRRRHHLSFQVTDLKRQIQPVKPWGLAAERGKRYFTGG